MQSQWNENEAVALEGDDLKLRVYTSQLLGREPSLVLHGGGNTSVKSVRRNLLGDDEDILFIKGSGWDLATIGEAGFAPARLHTLQRLAQLPVLSDSDMMRELKAACTLPSAPAPSVEAILHAIMPPRFVDHTHADAVVTISNTPDGEQILCTLYGDEVLILPYVMPGFVLAQQVYAATRDVDWSRLKGIILLHHGVFTFADDARTAYENMIDLVDRAEQYLQQAGAWGVPAAEAPAPVSADALQALARMRREASRVYGRSLLARWDNSTDARAYASHSQVAQLATRGPLTPDHTLHTKRTAMVVEDVDAAEQAVAQFAEDYRAYFAQHAKAGHICLDAAPRVGVWQDRGQLYFAPNAKRLQIVADIASHTRRAIARAAQLSTWQALPAQDIFDLEYWELEQAKLKAAATLPALEGKVALVTGAASGIGKACAEQLLAAGAAVVALDINPAVSAQFRGAAALGLVCDVTDNAQLAGCVAQAVQTFGGIDILVCNAGFFPASCPLERLDDAVMQRSLTLNFTAHFQLLRECVPFLRQSLDASVVVIASKNVPAPGPGALAYSAAKAALTQMVRVAALELGGDGIRINALHPNAVFDTAIWTDEVLTARAQAYGLSVADYKTHNVLRREVTSLAVARAAVALCTDFSCTTGAQIAVDGGNDRVI